MPVKSDSWIIEQSDRGMIQPFARSQVKKVEAPFGENPVISYGPSSYGYDFRIGNTFKILKPGAAAELDPKNINLAHFESQTVQNYLLLPPHTLALGQTVEYFKIPRDILTICFGKSTYARCGVFVNVTPFEPEWEGFATIAISNSGNTPVRVYAGEGIAQLIFLQADEVCATSYQDRKGKYQAQSEITAAKV